MKPLRLTLQAFGPFAGRQTIDFRPALDAGLFGIYGATGSGKSTIFSAMTFALFGEAARDEQHATTLRADHADPALPTEVELIFESAGKRYRIVRRPEQMRPAKRGGGATKDQHKAWLFDLGDLDVDVVGDTVTGTVIAETKVGLVDAAIQAILGYGPAQFRQIVLLPQGRFETFLAADTDDRLKILRELFDVSLYRRLSERLKEEARAAEEEIRTQRAVCEGRLVAEGFVDQEALAAGIAEAETQQAELSAVAAQAKSTLTAATGLYEAAARTDAAFAEHLQAEAALARIEGEAEAMRATDARLTAARLAQALADVDAATATVRAQAEAAVRHHEAETARLGTAQTRAGDAATALRHLVQQAPAIEDKRGDLRKLRDHERRLAESAGLAAALRTAEAALAAEMTAAAKARTRYGDLASRHAASLRQLDQARATEVTRADLASRGAQARERLAAATAYETATVELAKAQANESRAATAAASAQRHQEIAEHEFQEAESALLSSHAQHLAARLIDGAPCPVCGATEHPAPARGTPADAHQAEAHTRARADLDAARTAASTAATTVEVARERSRLRAEALAALPVPTEAAAALQAELVSLQATYKALGPAADLPALEMQSKTLEADLANALAAQEVARAQVSQAETAAALARQALADALDAIPAPLRDAAALEATLARITAEIERHVVGLDQAQASERQASEALVAARRDHANAAANQHSAAERLATAEAALSARLAAHGLSPDAYLRHRADIALIPDLEVQLRMWGEARAVARARAQAATEAIATLDRPDIVALKAARDGAEAALQTATAHAATATARAAQLIRLRTDIATELARLDALEQQTAPLRDLAEAFAGRTGARMDLETYAIAAMFDQVLEAANLRLRPMTRGRYALVRESEGRGNARRGLGIAIDDTYTGRQRPTTTLSGGETFMAALALALGLSDIVESARGNIRLDTIFIDEGFGSLDSDGEAGTLEHVLQTLQDLAGQNRAVGIVSHVPLVQQAIPNGYWIVRGADGSRIEARI